MRKAKIKEALKIDHDTTLVKDMIVEVNDDNVCQSDDGSVVIEINYHNMSYLISDQNVVYLKEQLKNVRKHNLKTLLFRGF